MFLRFMRTLRNLLIIMTIVAVAILMPLNVVATQHTGDWPPIAFDIGFLSISSINLVAGKEPLYPQDNWYWPPVVATWLFTFLILVFLHRASNQYLIMRKQFTALQHTIYPLDPYSSPTFPKMFVPATHSRHGLNPHATFITQFSKYISAKIIRNSCPLFKDTKKLYVSLKMHWQLMLKMLRDNGLLFGPLKAG